MVDKEPVPTAAAVQAAVRTIDAVIAGYVGNREQRAQVEQSWQTLFRAIQIFEASRAGGDNS